MQLLLRNDFVLSLPHFSYNLHNTINKMFIGCRRFILSSNEHVFANQINHIPSYKFGKYIITWTNNIIKLNGNQIECQGRIRGIHSATAREGRERTRDPSWNEKTSYTPSQTPTPAHTACALWKPHPPSLNLTVRNGRSVGLPFAISLMVSAARLLRASAVRLTSMLHFFYTGYEFVFRW